MNEHLLNLLKESAASINITLNGQALDFFQRYYQELVIWNEKMNLTAVHSPNEIIIKHFVDSLTPMPYIVRQTGRLLDIGAGGGFPGIPLKIVLPDLHLFLLEASRKKSSFLKHVIRHLPLSRALVINARAESAMTDNAYHHTFDTVISRAAFKLPQLFFMGKHFLSHGGLLIAMKGPHLEEEEKDFLCDPNMRCVACHDTSLPMNGGQRILMIFKAYL